MLNKNPLTVYKQSVIMLASFKNEVIQMPDYKAMYFRLAASVASAVALLEKAQRQGEDSYIEGGDGPTPDAPADFQTQPLTGPG